jgi:superfamily II DNA or RNA helicase
MSAIRIALTDRVRIRAEDLTPRLRDILRNQFTHANPEHARMLRVGRKPTEDEPPYYRTWRNEQTDAGEQILTFPRGGLLRVREQLRNAGLTWTIEDLRTEGEPFEWQQAYAVPDHNLTLYPYQEGMVQAALAKQNCLLRAGTGAGKTVVAFALVARLKLPTIVIVWTGALMDQWVERLQKEMGLSKKQIGIIRGSKCDLKPITVAMQQSVVSRLKKGNGEAITSGFGVLIFDEVQRAAATTMFAAIDPFPAKYRIGISADESRKDRKEFLTYDLFGQVAAEVTRETLVAGGFVHDVEVCVVPTEFDAPWYRFRPDFNKLLAEMQEDEARNNLALSMAMQEVEAEEQVLVLSHRVEHCRTMDATLTAQGIKTGVLLGGQEFQEVFRDSKAKLLSGEYRAAVGTVQAIGQGLDIPRMSRMVCMTPIANNKQQFGQVRGRICRTDTGSGKTNARLYYLWDRKVYGAAAIMNLVRWNPTVKVLEGGIWVEGKEYLKRLAAGRSMGGIFKETA